MYNTKPTPSPFELARDTAKKIAKTTKDPRKARGIRYSFQSLLTGILMALLRGYDDPTSISDYLNYDNKYMHRLFKEKRPSQGTIRYFLKNLDAKVLLKYSASIAKKHKPRVVSLDGKTLCGSRGSGKKALHILNMACNNGMTLLQMCAGRHSMEQRFFSKALKSLPLKDRVITADALHTTQANASLICQKEADYLFLVKKSQPFLLGYIKRVLKEDETWSWENTEKSHGRIVTKKITVAESGNLEGTFNGAQQVFSIETTTYEMASGKTTTALHYGITSLSKEKATSQALLYYRKVHWQIENGLHYILDVAFREDFCRVRHENTASVLSAFRKLVLTILRDTNANGIKATMRLNSITA